MYVSLSLCALFVCTGDTVVPVYTCGSEQSGQCDRRTCMKLSQFVNYLEEQDSEGPGNILYLKDWHILKYVYALNLLLLLQMTA